MMESYGILGWIVIGLLAGAIAKLLMPGKDPGGCIITILLGIAGALLAGFIGKSIGWYQEGEAAGFLAAIVGAFLILLVTGVATANFLGLRLLRAWESVLIRIPFVKSIYSSVKQVSDTLLSDQGNAFRKALLVQYPREGRWTIGFLTGVPGGDVRNHLQGDYVSLYIPTTPNPTSGFFLMVPRADTIELEMNVDEALKYIVSMGVVAPEYFEKKLIIDPAKIQS